MEKTNPLYKKDYPEWKKNLIRAGRVFLQAFIPSFFVVFKGADITGVEDLTTLKEVLIKLLISAGIAGVASGFNALFNYLRDLYPNSIILAQIPL